MQRKYTVAALAGAMILGTLFTWAWADAPREAGDPAVERTRKTVRMLDDLYKGAIVLITENYVDESSDLAAGSAFQALFSHMKEKGWHEVRLLDATGDPLDEDNAPRDDFERRAIERLKAGDASFEEVVEADGGRLLRVATPIPVVLKKCTLCHESYNDLPEGQAIGALGYTIAIE